MVWSIMLVVVPAISLGTCLCFLVQSIENKDEKLITLNTIACIINIVILTANSSFLYSLLTK